MMKIKIITSGIILFFSFFIFSLLFKESLFLKKGDFFKEKGKLIWAMDYYSYVIICYVPFSPFIKKAEKKIFEISRYYENKGDWYKAIFGYELLRSSLFQIRSFYQPKENFIKKLNYKIAKIKARLIEREFQSKEKFSFNQYYQEQLKILKYNDFPSNLNTLISSFLFFLWIGTIFFSIYKSNLFKDFFIYNIFSTIFFILWIISLYYE